MYNLAKCMHLHKEWDQMDKVRVGVLGGRRGTSMIRYCKEAMNAEVVAICDREQEVLERQKKYCEGLDITFYDNFDEFINHDMDAVVLANCSHEHAPFAVAAMKKGLHVFTEVVPCQTMKEAVELIETVEQTKKIYAYGENFCYMPAVYEMKKLYEQGKLGELEYAECEYIHNCMPIWPMLAYGDKNHWRNNLYATFYCTHSLGPIIHGTGLRPVKVVGFEGAHIQRHYATGCKSGQLGIEMVTLNNNAIVKSAHGGLYKNSYWYCMYGSKGRLECAREDAPLVRKDDVHAHLYTLYANLDEAENAYDTAKLEIYTPERHVQTTADVESFGHAGGDFLCMYHFIEKVRGNKDADIIDVYEAMDMFLPGMFAYRSILAGGIPMEVPNLRDIEQREKWRNDTCCTDPKVAGDMLWPCFSRGNPEIDDSVYEEQARIYKERRAAQKLDEGRSH